MHRLSLNAAKKTIFRHQNPFLDLPFLTNNLLNQIHRYPFEFSFKFSSIQSPSSPPSSSLQIIDTSDAKPLSSPLCTFLPYTHNPNNLVDLICLNLKLNDGNAVSLREEVQWVLPQLGTHEISRVLCRCQSSPLSALNFFNWVKFDLGLRPSVQNYCIIVHILVWSQEFLQSMKFLVELANGECPSLVVFKNLVSCTEDCNWNPIVFDMLVKAYVKVGNVEEGLKAFKEIVKIGLLPSVSASNAVLNGLLKSNRVDECWEMYNEMGRVGIPSNGFTFNILTHVLCRDGDAGKVNEFLEKMEEEGFDPDVVTYNTLINSYCNKCRLDDAFYLYRIMYRRGVPPDLVTYTALMKGLCKENKVKEAHQLFHQMIHRGLDPDTAAYNSLISGYCKEGKMQKARLLFNEMVSSGLMPDDITCRLLIQGYRMEGRLLSSLNLIAQLQRLGVSIPSDIYNYLVIALCQDNRPNAANSLFQRMVADGGEGNLEAYNCLIVSYCKFDSINEALALKDEMAREGLKPDLLTYRALISCLCRLSVRKAELLTKEMVEAGVGTLDDLVLFTSWMNEMCYARDVRAYSGLPFSILKFFQRIECISTTNIMRRITIKLSIDKLCKLQFKLLPVGISPTRLFYHSLISKLSGYVSGQPVFA
ncbi:hypothetical protein Scep_024947 [Stephania cephalantha]|uniref:Pentatricopeptide repeat-containing protein n=1 Tax=Stephania cephalantha TaxID=152367 RepID=A0AAP0HXK5_9MAGN